MGSWPVTTAFPPFFFNPFGPGDRVLEFHTRVLTMSTVDKKEPDSLANWTARLTTALMRVQTEPQWAQLLG